MVILLFRTAFNRGSERYFTPAGSGIRDKVSAVVLDNGCQVLKKVGETDFYAYIQSFADSVDLKKILEQCTISGDFSLLDRVQGVYGDFTGFSENPADLQNLRIIVENAYLNLSDDVKKSLSFEDFLNSFGSEEGIQTLNALLTGNTGGSVPDGGDNIES